MGSCGEAREIVSTPPQSKSSEESIDAVLGQDGRRIIAVYMQLAFVLKTRDGRRMLSLAKGP